VIEKLRALRLTRAAELAASSFEETISYYAITGSPRGVGGASVPTTHLNASTRPARDPKIRRRTRVVGAFPDRQSALNLAAVQAAAHRHNRLINPNILEHRNIERLEDQQMRGAVTA
jgi:putative transposase